MIFSSIKPNYYNIIYTKSPNLSVATKIINNYIKSSFKQDKKNIIILTPNYQKFLNNNKSTVNI